MTYFLFESVLKSGRRELFENQKFICVYIGTETDFRKSCYRMPSFSKKF